jgi:hypothetical protein
MIVLRETTEEQTFVCIPRAYEEEVTLKLYDQTRNTTVEIEPVIELSGDYYYVSGVFSLKQNNWYVISLIYGETEIFKDTVFCTNQEVENYSINAGVYIAEPDADNTYIVI